MKSAALFSMANKIAVVTALAGVNPSDANDLYEIEHHSADYYVFTDREDLKIPPWWNRRWLYPASMDKKYMYRRACRAVKQLTHTMLPDYDYYIWHDNINRVGEDPRKLVERLGDNDMALFEHPIQKGWRGEMGGASGREHPSLVARTMRMLGEQLKIPNDVKVYETTAFIRKNNKVANTCFGLWNDLLNTLTSRDQVTLPVAIHYTKPKVGVLPGRATAGAGNNQILPNISRPLYFNGLTS